MCIKLSIDHSTKCDSSTQLNFKSLSFSRTLLITAVYILCYINDTFATNTLTQKVLFDYATLCDANKYIIIDVIMELIQGPSHIRNIQFGNRQKLVVGIWSSSLIGSFGNYVLQISTQVLLF